MLRTSKRLSFQSARPGCMVQQSIWTVVKYPRSSQPIAEGGLRLEFGMKRKDTMSQMGHFRPRRGQQQVPPCPPCPQSGSEIRVSASAAMGLCELMVQRQVTSPSSGLHQSDCGCALMSPRPSDPK